MRRAYERTRFEPATRRIIQQAEAIVQEEIGADRRITVRGVYYQFIGRDWFPDSWVDDAYNAKHGLQPGTKNTEKNYQRLCSIISAGRLAGLIDWEALQDRAREADVPQTFRDPAHLMDVALAAYQLDRWKGQPNYVEIWTEKDAQANNLEPLARRYQVPLQVNRGYSSSTAVYECAQRFIKACGYEEACNRDGEWGYHTAFDALERLNEDYGERGHDSSLEFEQQRLDDECPREREPHILYVGDLDPSGEDMVRDVETRMKTFGVHGLEVRKCALTIAQVRQYKLPPNPAKLSDSRAASFIARYGSRDSWEMDAMRSDRIVAAVEAELRQLCDLPAYDAIYKTEQADKKKLAAFVKTMTSKPKKKKK